VETEFLRQRVGLFGLVAAALLFLGLLARAAISVVMRGTLPYAHPSYVLQAVSVLPFLALWVATREPGRRRGQVETIETSGLIGGFAAIQAACIFLPLAHRPELLVTLALTQGFAARAVFVPSSASRTLGLGIFAGIPLVLSVYLTYRLAAPASEPGRLALTTGAWWAATTILCTAASQVIFGLRRQVDEAEQLGQYRLGEKLGEGAMGVVYRAHHAMLARPTAVKLLLPERLGKEAVARFEREVQLTARLTNQHTVTIYDYGRTPEGVFFYAMELLEGGSLERLVAVDGPQPPERVASIMDQVAAALSEAHGIGLIHRDIKPANIILTQQGGEPDVAKVVDFGLVKDIRSGEGAALSQTGVIAGTPSYMAPETILAFQNVDGRADIYGLGAVCYFLLTGEPVFKAATAGDVCMHHVHTPPIPPSKRTEREIPGDIEAIVLSCLAKDPEARPQTAAHVRARLWASETLGKWNTDRARRWWRDRGEAFRVVPEKAPTGPERTIAIARARARFRR